MKYVLAVSMIILLVMLMLPVLAEISATSNPDGEMIIGQQVVLRVRFPAAGMSVQQRVDQITTRLNAYLGAADFDPALINVRKFYSEYSVMYRDSLIVTADKKTAAFNMATSEQLANQWAANLRRVIPQAKAKTERM